MKKLVQLSPLLIITVSYIPSLILRLFSSDQTYDPIDRSTLSLLSSVWLMACQTAWLWTVGVELATNCTQLLTRDLKTLKASLFIPIAYVILPIATLLSILIPVNRLFPFLTFEFYSYLHTAALLCLIYAVYYIAKYLTTIELNRPTSFSEYISTFLAIIFFPIGIFFVQPRIKKALNSTPAEHKIG